MAEPTKEYSIKEAISIIAQYIQHKTGRRIEAIKVQMDNPRDVALLEFMASQAIPWHENQWVHSFGFSFGSGTGSYATGEDSFSDGWTFL